MKTYTEEFKKTIVELYENGNKNKSELAREYGTSEGNVRAWIKKYGKIKTSTGEVTTNDEILKLQKENQEIKIENEILKKALAIFSRQQKWIYVKFVSCYKVEPLRNRYAKKYLLLIMLFLYNSIYMIII